MQPKISHEIFQIKNILSYTVAYNDQIKSMFPNKQYIQFS